MPRTELTQRTAGESDVPVTLELIDNEVVCSEYYCVFQRS
ncbi:hypothetical protein C942_02684 [Photobacterium marinum]|uniref:Uncharacterized protein n=1 Tax=Photobacterium marinum TaxID=1056511 RepID=L8JEA0_9GAMM|nr:hypothetical protein C942_02684 [Photobacterium marinum]